MTSDEITDLLKISREIVSQAIKFLHINNKDSLKNFSYATDLPNEMKAKIDHILEEKILDTIRPLGYEILSEEKGLISSQNSSNYRFIIDPLDGTYNFVRGLGNSSISVAFYKENLPIFGVLGNISTGEVAWGGREFGSFNQVNQINVSNIDDISKAALCSGFPVRFDLNDKIVIDKYLNTFKKFGKIRMFGSASLSLLNVAIGAADYYLEEEIMIWDVAAGIAILEGAGGLAVMSQGKSQFSLNVHASNGKIKI
mgnify:CR=1 FL=1